MCYKKVHTKTEVNRSECFEWIYNWIQQPCAKNALALTIQLRVFLPSWLSSRYIFFMFLLKLRWVIDFFLHFISLHRIQKKVYRKKKKIKTYLIYAFFWLALVEDKIDIFVKHFIPLNKYLSVISQLHWAQPTR